MKFNWGTGIFVFLVVFLLACGIFIYFAMNQQVNLVHKDYYEKGVDYSEQMKVNERSKPFAHSIKTSISNSTLTIKIVDSLAEKIDSGTVLMFRPSDKSNLISGRYILKFTWYMNGEKYEVNQPVNVQ